ncbi:MAG: thiamine diphosphokinase [Candidatus Muiribacteriaceae bacterium]
MNLKDKALLILNGDTDIPDSEITDLSSTLIFPVDGGLHYAHRKSLVPEVLLGDFDSVRKKILDKYPDTEKIIYRSEKDQSDTELTLEHIRKKYKEISHIKVIGAYSETRIDHFLTNIQVFARFADVFTFELVDRRFRSLIFSGEVELENVVNDIVSIVSLTEKTVFESSEGLEYSLDGLVLESRSSRGLSNKIKTSRMKISIRDGVINLVFPAEYN